MNEHAVGAVDTLLDRRAEVVELGEDPAASVRDEELDRPEAVGEALGDVRPELLETFAARRGDLEGAREAVAQAPAAKRVDEVDLVEDELDGQLASTDLRQDAVHGGDRLLHPVVVLGGVDDVEDEVRQQRLLERGGEALDQLVREAPDEPDRVGHEVAAAVVLEAARGRVERLEEAVVDRGLGVGERVQERGLACVGVPGKSDHRDDALLARLPLECAPLFELAQLALEEADAATRDPAVGLELGLARAACPDAASEALEVLPHAAHARKVVLELGELHLELALGAPRVLGEDVEDELRPVDDARGQCVLEPPLLPRIELVVDDQRLGAGVLDELLELLELPFADVGAHVRGGPALDELADRLDASRAKQLAQLAELLILVHSGRQHGDDESALGLRSGRGVRVVVTHKAIMPVIRRGAKTRFGRRPLPAARQGP